jgi:hypothetical protein
MKQTDSLLFFNKNASSAFNCILLLNHRVHTCGLLPIHAALALSNNRMKTAMQTIKGGCEQQYFDLNIKWLSERMFNQRNYRVFLAIVKFSKQLLINSKCKKQR